MGKLTPTIVSYENRSGGTGQITIEHLKDASLTNIKMFAKVTVKPHSSIGLHEHIDDCETYYILSGEGIYTDNQATYRVKSGDCLFCSHHQTHAIENDTDKELTFIALISLS